MRSPGIRALRHAIAMVVTVPLLPLNFRVPSAVSTYRTPSLAGVAGSDCGVKASSPSRFIWLLLSGDGMTVATPVSD
jgi:hypothetical protein